MGMTARFTDAFEYARAHHAEDVRKGTTIPYVSHLLAVTALVLEHGGDETAAVAALLHDVVEDGGGVRALEEIRGRFGEDVAALVLGCSDTTAHRKEDWKVRKERYLDHLESAAPDVLLVSAADKLHNARSILADLRVHHDELWKRFNRGAREQLWYYGSLRDVFVRRMPGRLADELDRTVRDDQSPGRRRGSRRLARPALRAVVDRNGRVGRVRRLARMPVDRRARRGPDDRSRSCGQRRGLLPRRRR